MFRKKILLDLDGVLNEYNTKLYDENIIPKAKTNVTEFLNELSKDADLYLFTTRNHLLAAKWLIENNLDIYFKDITSTKIPAYLYLDDRTVCFKGDYEKTLTEIKEFKVYWKE